MVDKMFTVECPVHGVMDVPAEGTGLTCPIFCPICSKPLKRKYNVPSIHFHGTGFYNTDHK